MTHIKQRSDTAANWLANDPLLMAGEAGHESDTGKWKVGDGIHAWTSLYYKGGVDNVAGKTGEVDLVVGDVAGAAPINNPAFTGSPTAPTPPTTTNTTRIATTAWVKNQGYAAKDSPVFIGTPTAPEQSPTDDSLRLANTAWVRHHVEARIPQTVPTAGGSTLSYNTMTNAGWYVMDAIAPDAPAAVAMYLEVRSYGDNTEQIARIVSSGAIYRRLRTGGTWRPWVPDDLNLDTASGAFTLAAGIITAGEGVNLYKRGRQMTLQFYLRNNTAATINSMLTISPAYRPTQTVRNPCNDTSTFRSATLQPDGSLFLESGGLTAGNITYGTMTWGMALL